MKSLKELEAIRDKMKATIANRQTATGDDIRIVVGMATCGIAAGARNTLNTLTEELTRRNITNVKISQTGCIGMCRYEPIVEVYMPNQEKVTYVKVDENQARRIIADHIVNGNVVKDLLIIE